jgi:hypothetical protein
VLFTIEQEPVGPSYEALLEFAREHSGSFSLVWRHQLQFDPTASTLAHSLEPFLVEERVTNEWPGTKLFGHQATLRLYRPTKQAIALLVEAGSLYAWLAPARPEDLAFYTAARLPWLVTISHERDAAVDDSGVDLVALREAVPTLRLRGGQAAG